MMPERREGIVLYACRILEVDPKSLPRDLLYLADPSEALVTSYLLRGRALIAQVEGETVGEVVWLPTRPEALEIVNLAVRPAHQGQGLGRLLIGAVLGEARRGGIRTVEIGTGNSSIGQLALYQKCEFRIVGVDPDFFLRHYPEPIVENGIRCRDMVRLAQHLGEGSDVLPLS